MPLYRAKKDCRFSLDGVNIFSMVEGEEKDLPEKAFISFGEYLEQAVPKSTEPKKTLTRKKATRKKAVKE